jgi:hypothetical protein
LVAGIFKLPKRAIVLLTKGSLPTISTVLTSIFMINSGEWDKASERRAGPVIGASSKWQEVQERLNIFDPVVDSF